MKGVYNMKKSNFMNFCLQLVGIALIVDKDERDRRLNLLMSQGYLWLDLTDKQVDHVKHILIMNYPDKCKIHEPDENGFTMDFEYLRFK